MLAPGGRFLEIGKRGIWTPEQVAARSTRRRLPPRTTWPTSSSTRPALIGVMLERVLDDVRRRAACARCRVAAFAADDVGATRSAIMAQARHIGKVVVTHPAGRRASRARTAAYLVTGGLGGLGLAVAGWLVDARRRHLVAGRAARTDAGGAARRRRRSSAARCRRSRSSRPTSPTAQTGAASLGAVAASGAAAARRRSTPPACSTTAPSRSSPGAVRGACWRRRSTARGSSHDATRQRAARPLRAVLVGVGAARPPGQGNYAAANGVLDALAHRRRAAGSPA